MTRRFSVALLLLLLPCALADAVGSLSDDGASSQLPRASLRVLSGSPIDHLGSISLAYELPATASPLAPTRDWIGVYCVDNETRPNRDDDFVDTYVLPSTYELPPGVPARGIIAVDRVPNMRCSWQFRLFRALDKKHHRLAHTPYVRMSRGPEEPLQVHLAIADDPTEMRVMWVSAAVAEPHVEFGTDPESLDRKVVASASSYAAEDMCEAPATAVRAMFYRDPGVLYDAVMSGLQPGKTYYYRVGGSTKSGNHTRVMSSVFKFQATLPAGYHDGKPQSFFVYGDMGDWDIKPLGALPDNRTATTAQLMREDMDDGRHNWLLAMHDGDISYAKGRTFLWDQFGSVIEPVAAELPYIVGVGNHDYCYQYGGVGKDPSGAGLTNGFHPPNAPDDCSSGGECGVPLNKRFIMPNNATGNGVFWFSFDVGLMHHVMLSGEHDYTPGSPMYNWLLNDLMRVDRAKTPWLFVHIHRPMYCSEQYEADYQLSVYIRKYLEPLMGAFGVDVVFSGHYHAYERTCPVFQEQCRSTPIGNDGLERAQAPVHIMVGSAGAYVDTAGYYDVEWSARAMQTYGYGRMHVFNATHALYEFKSNEEREVTDSSWIISDHKWHKDVLIKDMSVFGEPLTDKPVTKKVETEEMKWRRHKQEQELLGLYVETPDDLRKAVNEKIVAADRDEFTRRPPSDAVLSAAIAGRTKSPKEPMMALHKLTLQPEKKDDEDNDSDWQ